MIWIPGGVFHMGSDDHYPEEAPMHEVAVQGFWIDRTPVTNRAFARFVAETGYVTAAEQLPCATNYPDADPQQLVPGSLVFASPGEAGDNDDWTRCWRFVPGADWRHPQGPDSSIDGLADHPVVHVSYDDAMAYARWHGKALPSEAEWEYAARGGLDRTEFSWGALLLPDGIHRANLWQGRFPDENLALDGYAATSPVTAFAANGYGLFDMIGNVWEWTDDWYRPDHRDRIVKNCCLAGSADVGGAATSAVPYGLGPVIPRKVLKGGSHLCAPNYCRRYRPAARQPQTIDTASVHIGFRCVQRTGT
ncbi:formylglycine-generating enzyme family protein [Geminicoccus sp.]|uniref:formylglycine-generating enzyme family protein n=1 Tax=Geminicoccus sp. TaxID=2024832 RepID=UPI0039C868B4